MHGQHGHNTRLHVRLPSSSKDLKREYEQCTVPTFNSCTECTVNPGIIHNYTSDCQDLKREYEQCTVPTFNSCTECTVNPGIIHDYTSDCPHPLQLPGHWCMDDLKTNILAMGVCTTRQWQTASRLVQEFNVCTVMKDNKNPYRMNE